MSFTDDLVRQYMRSQWQNHRRELNEFSAREELLGGALIYSYGVGTTTPAPVYMDAECTTAQANPMMLPASGEVWPLFIPPEGRDLMVASAAWDGGTIAKVSNCGPDFKL